MRIGLFVGAAAILVGLAGPASAEAARSAGGEWTGRYICRQGVTGARLILSEDGSRGVFHFYPLPENPRVPQGCYQVTGVFSPTSGALAVMPGSWYMRPRRYESAAFSGEVDSSGQVFSGKIIGLSGCSSVMLSRAAPTLPLPSVCARGLP